MGQNKCQVVSNECFAFNGQDRQDQCGNSVYLIMLVHFDYEIPSDFLFRLSTLTNTFFSTSIHFLTSMNKTKKKMKMKYGHVIH